MQQSTKGAVRVKAETQAQPDVEDSHPGQYARSASAKIIKALRSAARDHDFTDEQLHELMHGEEIALELSNHAAIMEGLAALIANDSNAGNFRNTWDLSQLLWGFSTSIATLAEAVDISTEAAEMLLLRNKNPQLKGSLRV